VDKYQNVTEKENEVEKVRRLLPYWARELLRMWENAERRHKTRGSSLPGDS